MTAAAANLVTVVGAVTASAVLALPAVRRSILWRAAVTPLASIIGSGFLIAAPLLYELGGILSPWLMTALTVVAYGLGAVIRANIADVEPILEDGSARSVVLMERVTAYALAFAYVVSIAYYIYLFSAFALRIFEVANLALAPWICSSILLGLATFGRIFGLSVLERLEKYTVSLKLAVIFGILAGLALYRYGHGSVVPRSPTTLADFTLKDWRVYAGLLIMVQGFETSRYIGETHSRQIRIKSMRLAQVMSAVIYVVFVYLFTAVLQRHEMHGEVRETAILGYAPYIAPAAWWLLAGGALASQFSAAVADMSSGGGLFQEMTASHLSSRNAYLLMAVSACGIVAITDVFGVVAYASRAFALYYFFQCCSYVLVQRRRHRNARVLFGIAFGILSLLVAVFGRPMA